MLDRVNTPLGLGALRSKMYVLGAQMEVLHDLALRLWSDYEWALSISGKLICVDWFDWKLFESAS